MSDSSASSHDDSEIWVHARSWGSSASDYCPYENDLNSADDDCERFFTHPW